MPYGPSHSDSRVRRDHPSSLRRRHRLAGLVAWGGCFLAAASWCATPDDRFGFVGDGGPAFAARFHLPYYTLEGNYPGSGNLFSSVNPANDPAAGFSAVREVAKLNVRNDGLGESNTRFREKLERYAEELAMWYILFKIGPKPEFHWYQPDPAALARAESLQIVETIRREKAREPQITGTVWEIGNEPNLFPALTPGEYASIYRIYHGIIKGEDPSARVAMGSLFMPEPAGDLKARLRDELETQLRISLQAAGLYDLVKHGAFPALVGDLENTLLSRMLHVSSAEYLAQALDSASVHPDIVTFHVYGYDDRAPTLDSAGFAALFGSAMAQVLKVLEDRGIQAEIWVTEFGNIRQGMSESEVAGQAEDWVGIFRDQGTVSRWFWYKPVGRDEQFALISSEAPPVTRLAADPAFHPVDGVFSCSDLNAVGLAYYRLSHGEACRDPDRPPVIDSLSLERTSLSEGDSALFRVHASDPDDDSLAYVWLTAGDTLGTEAVLRFLAGTSDSGMHTLTVRITSGPEGLSAQRSFTLAIGNISIPPFVANEPGSELTPDVSLRWQWPDAGPDPDLDPASTAYDVELRLTPDKEKPLWKTELADGDSLLLPAHVALPAGPVVARVRARDAGGYVTDWSPWVKLTVPATVGLSAPASGPLAFALAPARDGSGVRILRLRLTDGVRVGLDLVDMRGATRMLAAARWLERGEHALALPAEMRSPGGAALRLRIGTTSRLIPLR